MSHHAKVMMESVKERREKRAARKKAKEHQYVRLDHDEEDPTYCCLICGAADCHDCETPTVPPTPKQVTPQEAIPVASLIMKKTRISVDNVCCELETKLIKKTLGSRAKRVDVDVVRREVVVAHTCPPEELVDLLNEVHLGARLFEASTNSDKKEEEQRWCPRLSWTMLAALCSVSLLGLGLALPAELVLAAVGAAGCSASLVESLQSLYRMRRVDMNALIFLATGGSLASGDYFEAASVTSAFLVSRALQIECLRHVRRILDFQQPPPTEYFSLTQKKQVSKLSPGELVAARAGDASPETHRCRAKSGKAVCDQSSVTGESVPVTKKRGDTVWPGTLVVDGYLELEVLEPREEDEIDFEEAANQSRVVDTTGSGNKLATKIAAIVAPCIVVAALVALVPFDGSGKPRFQKALALLVLACPCSLVLAGPLPCVAAIAAAGKRKIFISKGDALENLQKIDLLALDKTGTLTEGSCQVVDQRELGSNSESALKLAASLESKSAHPLAAAVVSHATNRGAAHVALSNDVYGVETTVGGITGIVDGVRVDVGNTQLVKHDAKFDEDLGGTVIGVAVDGVPQIALLIVDPLKESAASVVERLATRVKKIVMLTGDAKEPADAVAKALAPFVSSVRAGLTPAQKNKWIQDADAKVVMIGDGANDAAALESADVGIAVSGAASAAGRAADLVSPFDKIPLVFDLSDAVVRILKQNIAISVALKIAIAAAVALNRAGISAAVLADLAGLLLVAANGLRPLSLIACEKSDDAMTSTHTKPSDYSVVENGVDDDDDQRVEPDGVELV